MPQSVRWKGSTIYRPGSYTFTNLSALTNVNVGADAAIIIIGEADAGQPQASASTPVYHTFTSFDQMISTFLTGNLAECARSAFKPAKDGQDEYGVPIKGANRVYAIKTNQSTQASYAVVDGSSNTAVTIKDNIWGLKGNQTWTKIEASGTGFKLTAGRDNEPNIGSQVSPALGVDGTDEWLKVGVTAAFTGASCTLAFDGTDLVFNSSVAGEDKTITCTGKTIEEIAQEINAFAPITTACYIATVLRANRSAVLSTYLDEFTGSDIFAADKSYHGQAYDLTDWITANSVYLTATWARGVVPVAYTLTYLSGGTTGVSTEATILAALKVAKKINARFIVSAYSADVGAGGAVAVSTINGHFGTHVNACNPIGGRAERQGFVCTTSTTKSNLWTELQSINNEYLAAVNDKVYLENPAGTRAWLGTHVAATMGAAIMAGSPVGTPLTQKYVNCYDITPVATDLDVDDDTDAASIITNGLLVLEVDPGEGFRFMKGITTYKTEDNDGRIKLEVVEARLHLHRLLRINVERPFTGHKGRGVLTTNAYRGRCIEVFRNVSDANDPDVLLIEGTDTDGNPVAPYRDVVVWLSGDQLYLTANVTFTQGIEWAFNELRATLPTALAS